MRTNATADERPSKAKDVQLAKATPADHDLCCDLVDCALRADAYIPRGQMLGILRRATSDVWLIHFDGELAGFAITYRSTFLHNLHLAPWARGQGVGTLVLEKLKPRLVRSKTNMVSGDPSAFYESNGYTEVARDPKRPHIALMARGSNGHHDAATAKNQTEDEMLTVIKNLLGMRAKAAAAVAPVAQVTEVCHEQREQSAREQRKMVQVTQEAWDEMQLSLAKWEDRKAKQAGYQRKRQAKIVKMKSITGELNAPSV